MSRIDFAIESPIKMMEPLIFDSKKKLIGKSIPKSMRGIWEIKERTNMSNKGGYAKVVRVMTGDPVNEPIGEYFTLPYGMVCSTMIQVQLKPVCE